MSSAKEKLQQNMSDTKKQQGKFKNGIKLIIPSPTPNSELFDFSLIYHISMTYGYLISQNNVNKTCGT